MRGRVRRQPVGRARRAQTVTKEREKEMASPKNKKSKMRKRQRVAQLEKAIVASVQACPVCGAMKQTHHVCPSCGVYNGKQILPVSAK